MSVSPGDRLGPYELLSSVGVGGMGEVYRARDTRLARDVAVKVIAGDSTPSPDRLHRFEQEAKALAALDHPHILAVHDVGTEHGTAYVVFELLDGETLRQRLERGALPTRKAVELAVQICQGLAAAHARGITHRDLKPENLFLTRDGRLKILDFGLAKLHSALDDRGVQPTGGATSEITGAGTVLGTVGYMSPEQVKGVRADSRSDIFSFGCVLYEMLARRRAFHGETAAETMTAILHEDPPDIAERTGGVPPALERIVRRCLEKRPDERFQSTHDIAFALEAISGSAAAPTWLTAIHPVWARALRKSASHILWILRAGAGVPAFLLGGVLVLAVAAAGWLRFQASRGAIDSLAVLPFENASRDPEAEYLGDGLTESLINQMSRVPSLRVMARATVFRFKGAADPLEAGRKLGVGAVLTGSVSRRGDQLKVTAELVEVASGVRLWGDKFDRPFADLLRVQDSIASDISEGLRLPLSGPEKTTLGRHGTEDPEAYELFLKARFSLQKETQEDNLESRRLFLQALQKDPKFVEAHIGVATTYGRSAIDGWARPGEVWPPAHEEAQKALALDPSNVVARCVLVNLQFYFDWDWKGVEQEYQELSTDPRVLLGEQFRPQFRVIGLYFWAVGRPEKAVALMERALRVDPGNLNSRLIMADFLAQAGRLDQAISDYRAIAEADPTDSFPLVGLAEVLRRKGDLRGAIDALRKAYELSEEQQGTKALATARTEEDYENAETTVARVRLGDLEALANQQQYVSPFYVARLHAKVGEREKAFAKLDAALVERSPGLVFLKVDREWDRIRDDPRFAAAVKRVGIP